jgi:hypothetical protein
LTRKKQREESSKSQHGTKSSLNLPQRSPELSWLVGDKQQMIERRRAKLAQTGVDVCLRCGGCIFIVDGRKMCGDCFCCGRSPTVVT